MNSVDTFRINKQFVQLLGHNLDTNEQYFELRLDNGELISINHQNKWTYQEEALKALKEYFEIDWINDYRVRN